MGDSLKEFSLDVSSNGGGNNGSIRSETFGNIQRFVFVSSVQRQLSDKSQTSQRSQSLMRDLVPFRTTTSCSELKIHSTNVAAGDFPTGRLSGLKVILA